ncbi:transposase [Nocardia brasiliensis]
MPRPRRSYSPEYRVEAAHRVIDSGPPVRDVARELDVHENLLHKWVRDERRRMASAGQAGRGGTQYQRCSTTFRGRVCGTGPVAGHGDRAGGEDGRTSQGHRPSGKASAYLAARHPK